jgi:hypothetical protein
MICWIEETRKNQRRTKPRYSVGDIVGLVVGIVTDGAMAGLCWALFNR